MNLKIILSLLILSFLNTAWAGDAEAGKWLGQSKQDLDCETILSSGRTLQKLLQILTKRNLNDGIRLRIRMRAKSILIDDLEGMKDLERAVEKYGSEFRLVQILPGSGHLLFEFHMKGTVRTLVHGLMLLMEPSTLNRHDLEPVSWDELEFSARTGATPAQRPPLSEVEFAQLMRKKIEDLNWSVRTTHALVFGQSDTGRPVKVLYIGDLVQRSEKELLRIAGLGHKSLKEIRDGLAEMGLQLATDVPGWPYPGLEPTRVNRGSGMQGENL